MNIKIKTAFMLMIIAAILLIVTCGTVCVLAEETEAETVVESEATTEEVTEDFIEDNNAESETEPTEDVDEPETEPTEDDEPETEPTEDDESETEPTEDVDEPEAEPTEDDEPETEPTEDVDEPETEPTEDDEPETEPAEEVDEPETEPTEDDESETEPTEDDEPETEPTEEVDESETGTVVEDETTIEEVAASFVEYLKSIFGNDYTTYYNAIIDNWGTIEEYLLSFGESVLSEQYQTGWQEFVSWLGEYSPVWAPILAITVVVIAYLIGKRRLKKILQEVVDAKIAVVGDELNKQDKATTTILHSVSALLGTNKKFADNVKEIEESEKELNS